MAEGGGADADKLLAVVPLLTGSVDVNSVLEGEGQFVNCPGQSKLVKSTVKNSPT